MEVKGLAADPRTGAPTEAPDRPAEGASYRGSTRSRRRALGERAGGASARSVAVVREDRLGLDPPRSLGGSL